MARSHLFNHFTYLRMIIKELKESLLLFTIDLNIFEETQVIHSYKNFFFHVLCKLLTYTRASCFYLDVNGVQDI